MKGKYNMKVLTSFRLSEKTKQSLKYLSKKHELSQAELIEVMCDFVELLDYDFSINARAYKLQKNPAFKKWEAEYNKLSRDEQKIMRQKLIDDGFDFDD
jgi:predicted DNA-binding protein